MFNIADYGAVSGGKVIGFKECTNVILRDFTLLNVTDLAIDLAGCEDIRAEVINPDVRAEITVDDVENFVRV